MTMCRLHDACGGSNDDVEGRAHMRYNRFGQAR